jgi:hypothetical protein
VCRNLLTNQSYLTTKIEPARVKIGRLLQVASSVRMYTYRATPKELPVNTPSLRAMVMALRLTDEPSRKGRKRKEDFFLAHDFKCFDIRYVECHDAQSLVCI